MQQFGITYRNVIVPDKINKRRNSANFAACICKQCIKIHRFCNLNYTALEINYCTNLVNNHTSNRCNTTYFSEYPKMTGPENQKLYVNTQVNAVE